MLCLLRGPHGLVDKDLEGGGGGVLLGWMVVCVSVWVGVVGGGGVGVVEE